MKEFDIKYRERLIDTFRRLTLFLEENNLKYYAGYGTLLGAVRHKGLIPWDDDIDIHMFREDYERLFSIKDKLTSFNLRLSSMEEDGYYMHFAKVCDTDSTILEFPNQQYVLGLYIDIFVLDRTSLSEDEFQQFDTCYKRLWRLCNASTSVYTIKELFSILANGDISYFFRQIGCVVLRLFKKQIRQKILKLNDLIKNNTGETPTLFFASYNKHFFESKWFKGIVSLEFEGYKIKAPIDYEGYLTYMYNNYMELPPLEKRTYKHSHAYANLSKALTFKEAKKRISKGYIEEM